MRLLIKGVIACVVLLAVVLGVLLLLQSRMQDVAPLSDSLPDNISLPKYVTDTKPVLDENDKRLRVSVYSSSALEPVVSMWVCSEEPAFDGKPLCTGVEPIPGSDLRRKVEDLPNSYYTETSSGILVGFDTEARHTITLEGTDAGTFTLEIEEAAGDGTVRKLVYSDVGTASGTVAVLSLQTLDSVSPLRIDMEGDGVFEATVSSDPRITE